MTSKVFFKKKFVLMKKLSIFAFAAAVLLASCNGAEGDKAETSEQKEVAAQTGATNTVSGNLTIKDKTVNVKFPAKVAITDNEISVESKFTINRQDWGLTYGTEGDPKDWGISQDVDIELNIKAKK